MWIHIDVGACLAGENKKAVHERGKRPGKYIKSRIQTIQKDSKKT